MLRPCESRKHELKETPPLREHTECAYEENEDEPEESLVYFQHEMTRCRTRKVQEIIPEEEHQALREYNIALWPKTKIRPLFSLFIQRTRLPFPFVLRNLKTAPFFIHLHRPSSLSSSSLQSIQN